MRPALPIASFVGIPAGIDVVFSRTFALIAYNSLVDSACVIFDYSMWIWCGIGGSLRAGALDLLATYGCCSLSFVGTLLRFIVVILIFLSGMTWWDNECWCEGLYLEIRAWRSMMVEYRALWLGDEIKPKLYVYTVILLIRSFCVSNVRVLYLE